MYENLMNPEVRHLVMFHGHIIRLGICNKSPDVGTSKRNMIYCSRTRFLFSISIIGRNQMNTCCFPEINPVPRKFESRPFPNFHSKNITIEVLGRLKIGRPNIKMLHCLKWHKIPPSLSIISLLSYILHLRQAELVFKHFVKTPSPTPNYLSHQPS